MWRGSFGLLLKVTREGPGETFVDVVAVQADRIEPQKVAGKAF